MSKLPGRREFLAATSLLAASMTSGGSGYVKSPVTAEKSPMKSGRPGIGAIGLRYQGSVIARTASMFGPLLAICDVDKDVRDPVKAAFGSVPHDYEDYHDLLARADIDVVTIGTPDHWHTKMVIDACRAGKDVYCEKPLTLTIDEGKLLRDVVRDTGRIVQVGSWQRSDFRFRQAVEMVRQGRVGKLQSVDVVLGKNVVGGPFKTRDVPRNLNWDLWKGQTPDVPFMEERAHYTFRWWYEYSGGQMTDWGAHHIDIAQWGIDSLPVEVDGRATMNPIINGYNVAADFGVTIKYGNDVVLTVSDTGRNGILFTGDQGRIFVNRGSLEGKPVEELESNPLPGESWNLYDFDNLDRPPRVGKLDAIVNHMGNFFDCVEHRRTPISSVDNQHRSVSTCHLANISMRLGRKLQWDPETEYFVDDAEANTWLKREQRSGYEII